MKLKIRKALKFFTDLALSVIDGEVTEAEQANIIANGIAMLPEKTDIKKLAAIFKKIGEELDKVK